MLQVGRRCLSMGALSGSHSPPGLIIGFPASLCSSPLRLSLFVARFGCLVAVQRLNARGLGRLYHPLSYKASGGLLNGGSCSLRLCSKCHNGEGALFTIFGHFACAL